MSRKPTLNIDYTSRDYEAFRDLLIAKLQEKMPEYTDTTESDAGIVIIEALANGLDILSLYADITANDVLLPTTQSRRLAVLIANCLGYYPYNQTASEYEQVFVLTGVRTVDTVISKGTVVKTKKDSSLATLYYVTADDLVIPAGALGNEQDSDGNYLYHVKIVAGEVIKQDIIGTSTGAKMQSFNCSYTKVIVDSLEVFVDEGTGEELWKRVDTFFDSDENSKVYIAMVDEFDQCTIQFGNGIHGKIPTAFPNGIIANYRIGGGEVSNVNENVITVLETGVAHVESTFNLEVSTRGHNKESLESIKINAPAAFRSRDRLVILEDYEDLLRLNYYDFLDLKAVQDTTNRMAVHVYYMMRDGYEFTPDLAESVAEFISARSMIGCSCDIQAYTPQIVDLTIKMYMDKDYDEDTLKDQVKQYLEMVTFKYGNLVFGDTLVKSDVENEIKSSIPGVISLRINTPTEDIITPRSEDKVLTLGGVTIETEAI